jgi:NTE family protein
MNNENFDAETTSTVLSETPTINPTTTEHAKEKYTPDVVRKGNALCLSGGGFRASLFHLGALRRLNELGILSQIDRISSVSGGSIISAHLSEAIRPWPARGTVFPDWEEKVSAPFRRFCSKNLRNVPLVAGYLKPWNWFSKTAIGDTLAKCYEEITERNLVDLPDHPRFTFCATDMTFGVNWIFEKRVVGDYQAGFVPTPPDWKVARGVAASSCFPPIFKPIPIGLNLDDFKQHGKGLARARKDYDACIQGIRLTDGGNYDNMGLEPVWKNYAYVLVSDGGAAFDFEPDQNALWRLNRYTQILGNQASALRKRWLMSNFQSEILRGTYWGIGSAVKNYGEAGEPGYDATLITTRIASIRTDIDSFTEAEAKVLENHGYFIANAAARRHIKELIASDSQPVIPHPEWMDEPLVAKALAESGKRFVFGH